MLKAALELSNRELVKEIDALRAQLATAEKERDEARGERDDLFHECEEVLTAYGDPEGDETFAIVVGRIAHERDEARAVRDTTEARADAAVAAMWAAEKERDAARKWKTEFNNMVAENSAAHARLQSRLDESEAQLDTARGEAAGLRAHLESLPEKARWVLLDQCVKRGHDPRSAIGDWSLNVGDFLRSEIESMNFLALAAPGKPIAEWQAEAVAEEMDRWAERWWNQRDEITAGDFTVRALDLHAEAARLRGGGKC